MKDDSINVSGFWPQTVSAPVRGRLADRAASTRDRRDIVSWVTSDGFDLRYKFRDMNS